MKKVVLSVVFLLFGILYTAAQSIESNIEQRLKDYFNSYTTNEKIGKCHLNRFDIDHQKRTIDIYPNANFGYQSFTPEKAESVYNSIKQFLPGPVNYYSITVYADNKPIEQLIPNFYIKKQDKSKLWGKIEYKENPWVKNISRPYTASKGLEERHIAIWQSHGKYYKNNNGTWEWQRPNLFATREDIFTQSFVVPYIIPMLQNAGAVVFTPRERDWQTNEVIVDNDGTGFYQEIKSKKSRWKTANIPGFALKYRTYTDNNNPFTHGTVRFATTEKKPEKAFAQWIPNIPETGKYAVYVTYQTLPESVSDAKYLVFHKGGVTEFLVNQQIGNGTWVYLGTFEFDKGTNDYGMVVLSNESKQKGVVCADAVRFGGGMGNIVRGKSTSGLPRYLEGARYSAQWYGMPYSVYSASNGTNDYNDDINTRGLEVNYLSGGSVYNPTEKGLRVPIEVALGLHSDAGFSREDSIIGSLGIYTTDANNGFLNTGVSRYASRDLSTMVLDGLQNDINSHYGINWTTRGMWNKNYSETRRPAVPSMILELLAHQNFADMQYGHDPYFKFLVGRSVYKSLLKYIAAMHDEDYVVQPLPINNFMITKGKKKHTFNLSWKAVNDPIEPTAKPQGYIVYTRIGHGGFDNGTMVNSNQYTFKGEAGLVYSFKVTAVNKGGESFPSEILSAYSAKESKKEAIIINGFDRLSGPMAFNNPEQQGFDMDTDAGLSYISTPAFCGNQVNFNKKNIGSEGPSGLGYSNTDLEGKLIAGNTFDYTFIHGKAIQGVGKYSFVSCSDEAVENGYVNLDKYDVVDYITGADKSPYPTEIQKALTIYCQKGGNVMISGAYIGSSNNNIQDSEFTKNILKYSFGGSMLNYFSGNILAAGNTINIPSEINEKTYSVNNPDCIMPVAPAYSTFIYTPGNYSAAIAYKGIYRTFVMGFPFELINGASERTKVMGAILNFFDVK